MIEKSEELGFYFFDEVIWIRELGEVYFQGKILDGWKMDENGFHDFIISRSRDSGNQYGNQDGNQDGNQS